MEIFRVVGAESGDTYSASSLPYDNDQKNADYINGWFDKACQRSPEAMRIQVLNPDFVKLDVDPDDMWLS